MSAPTEPPATAPPRRRRRRVAILIDEVQLTQEQQTTILVHCPIVRMRLGQDRYVSPSGGDGRVYVVPPELCIGCGICARKNPETV